MKQTLINEIKMHDINLGRNNPKINLLKEMKKRYTNN